MQRGLLDTKAGGRLSTECALPRKQGQRRRPLVTRRGTQPRVFPSCCVCGSPQAQFFGFLIGGRCFRRKQFIYKLLAIQSAEVGLGTTSLSWEEFGFNPGRTRVLCAPPASVKVGSAGAGSPEAPREALRGQPCPPPPAPTPELWERYSGDRRVRRGLPDGGRGSQVAGKPPCVPPALAFNLIFT